jgi:putative transposase
MITGGPLHVERCDKIAHHDYGIQEALLGQEKSRSVITVLETRTSHTNRHVGSTRAEANAAAIRSYNDEHGTAIATRQVKYLNNVVEQDHRAVRRATRPTLGFKSFDAAQRTLVGIELMHMMKKRQMVVEAGAEGLTAADQFYALAA